MVSNRLLIFSITYSYGKDSKNGWNNLLVEVDKNGNKKTDTGETIAYDTIGNPTTYLGATLKWNGRKLTSYSDDDNTISYKYDSEGLRVSKTVNGVKSEYFYVNGQLHYEKRGDNKLYFFYDSNGFLSGIEYNETTYYPATNRRGDVVAIYNKTGNCIVRYEYDAWGNVLSVIDCDYYDEETKKTIEKDITNDTTSTDIAMVNPIRYRGYYYDVETGFYYLQSRYYNPEVGRFLNSDSISDSGAGVLAYNTFIYCANNPVNASDPSGHGVIWDWISDKITKLGDLCSSSFGEFVGMIEDTTKTKPQTPYLKSVSTVYDVVKTSKEVKNAVDDINNHTENIFGYGQYGESYTPKKLSQNYSFDDDYANHCQMIYSELTWQAPLSYNCSISQFDEAKIAEFKKNIITEDRTFGKDFIDIYGDKMVIKAIKIIY